MRNLLLLALATLAAVWVFAALHWPGLPERMPVHFGLDGTPDRFVERSLAEWLLLPALATALILTLAVALPRLCEHLAERGSQLLNVPMRRRFFALPAAARRRCVAPGNGSLRLIAVELGLLFVYLVDASARVAKGDAAALVPTPILLAIAVIVATALLAIPASRRRIVAEERALAAASSPDPQGPVTPAAASPR